MRKMDLGTSHRIFTQTNLILRLLLLFDFLGIAQPLTSSARNTSFFFYTIPNPPNCTSFKVRLSEGHFGHLKNNHSILDLFN